MRLSLVLRQVKYVLSRGKRSRLTHEPDTGVATALMFARYGCERMFVGDANGSRLEECRNIIASRYPSVEVYSTVFDRSSEEDVDLFFTNVTRKLGRIDFSVNVSLPAKEKLDVAGSFIDNYDRCYSVHQKGVRINYPNLVIVLGLTVYFLSTGISDSACTSSADAEAGYLRRDGMPGEHSQRCGSWPNYFNGAEPHCSCRVKRVDRSEQDRRL
jgi:hypothetical protein